MPFVAYKTINQNKLLEIEQEYINQYDEIEIDMFKKIKENINDIHKMYIEDDNKAHRYINKHYSNEACCIIISLCGEIISKFYLHNLSPKKIKKNFKEFNEQSLKKSLTYDITIEI